ncbi:MAG: hypothetical protein JXR20_01315 [Balneola sp.]
MWYKNVRAQNILILLFALFGIASTFYYVNLKPQLSPVEKHQIHQSVFSNILSYITEHPNEDPEYFFISVSSSDPSTRLLNDFAHNIPTVKPASSSEMSYGFSSYVSLKSDQSKRGILVDLKVMGKQPNGNVQVLASLYKSRSRSATYEYILNENSGSYQIISFKGSQRSEFLE